MKKMISFVLALVMIASIPMTAFAAEESEEVTTAKVEGMVADIVAGLNEENEATEEAPADEEVTQPEEEAPKVPDVLYFGDINKDGKVSSADARSILQFCAKMITFSQEKCLLADFDRSGAVSSSDARKALRTAARIDAPVVFNLTVSDPDMEYISYDNRRPYVAQLSGFSTNINVPRVFDKIKALEQYCGTLKKTVTFYYTDVDRNYYIEYNSNWVYRTQCTIKAPYIKSILVYMEKNNISLDTMLQLHSSQKWKSHYLSSFASGTWFSIRELIYYAIRISDNTAYQMLFDYFGPGIFNESAAKAGSKLRLSGYIFGETCASDMAKLFIDIYRYNGKYSEFLFENMRNASHNDDMIGAGVPDDITFMHKFGSGGNMTIGYHDCAVILTEVPCVLVIYTSRNTDSNYDKTPFGKIASSVIDINKNLEYF